MPGYPGNEGIRQLSPFEQPASGFMPQIVKMQIRASNSTEYRRELSGQFRGDFIEDSLIPIAGPVWKNDAFTLLDIQLLFRYIARQ